ncbi:hypothetical protein [Williamsia herbipolensis]|uniref:Lipoprotein n=1 Tax=Williamsia herbipolensis TaxID=1603258 RepID=A0AAU4K575_9NOCA|nr:hypothetical protein [Williamsia herbipolensis]
MNRLGGCGWVRACAVGAATGALVVVLSACATTVDGSGRVDPVQVSDYLATRSSASARASADAQTAADYATCAAVTSAAASASRAYNAFVARLNSTQSFDDLARTDGGAVDALNRAGSAVTGAITGSTSDQVRSTAGGFAARSTDLARVVAGKQRDALNASSTAWERARDTALSACGPVSGGGPVGAQPSAATPGG